MGKLSFRFGTVGSPKSTPKGGTVGGIKRLAELGLDALELGWVRSVRVSDKTAAKIKQTARDAGVSLSVHAPYFINLNADDEEWPKSRKRLLDAAYWGWKAGATDIVFHPGSYFGKPSREVLPVALRRLEEVLRTLDEQGVRVVLRPETMGKAAMLGSLDDVLAMARAFPGRVEPCLDFAHLHARPGDGSMNTYDEWARVLEAYGRALGDDALKRLHIHLSGIAYGPKGEKEHLVFSDADLNVDAILRALHDFGAQGRILCESPILEDDAQFLKERWQALTGEGGDP
ncbi:MAG: TIM barrel protein [Chloroflexi bacterium]|nr:TIM barrel protein [Chloroflexota bacterium]